MTPERDHGHFTTRDEADAWFEDLAQRILDDADQRLLDALAHFRRRAER